MTSVDGLPRTCSLYEPDGRLLSAGRCAPSDEVRGALLITALDRPGQLIQRCLLGNLREVWVHVGDAVRARACVERVSFDAQLGRTCVLRLGDVVAPDR